MNGNKTGKLRLFVGGMSRRTTADELTQHFVNTSADYCGNGGPLTVRDAVIIKDPQTMNSRGFGFIELETEREADDVIGEFHESELDGRKLTVNVAVPRPPKEPKVEKVDKEPVRLKVKRASPDVRR